MFWSKNKKKENDNLLFKEKYFSKVDIVNNNLRNRSLSFFKKEYSRNLSISLVFSMLSFVFIVSGILGVEHKNKLHEVYLTNVNTQVEIYNVTETRKKTLQESYNYRNGKIKEENGDSNE